MNYGDFDPPGRLGKRLGNFFVAVGSPSDRLGVVDVGFAGRFLAWMTDTWDSVPSPLNLLDPVSPTKRELLDHLRKANPDLTVLWLPTVVLVPLSWLATGLQKVLRPGKPAINVAKVFSVLPYDTSAIAMLAKNIDGLAAQATWFPAPVTLYFMTTIVGILLLLILFPLTVVGPVSVVPCDKLRFSIVLPSNITGVRQARFLVLIPAHNEEVGIASTLGKSARSELCKRTLPGSCHC